MTRTRLLVSTVNTSVLRLIGQGVALGSGIVIANFYGATTSTDHYYTALVLPGTIASLIVNVLSSVFAPVYLERIQQGATERRALLASLNWIFSLAVVAGLLINLLGVPLSVDLRALSQPEEIQTALTFGFAFVLLIPLLAYARLLGIICEADGHYSLPALAAVANPVLFILVLLLSYPALGIYSLLVANIAGLLVEAVIITVYALRRLEVPLLPRPKLHPAVREMLALAIPPTIAFSAMLFVPLFDRAIAATLDPGSLTAYHYGERVVVALDTLIMSSAVLVMHYHWATIAAQQGLETLARVVVSQFSTLFFGIAPLLVGGALVAVPLISVLFERGAFDATLESAGVLAVLLISLLFNYPLTLLTRLMLVIKDTRSQAMMGILISGMNAVLNLIFAPVLGLVGIALSTLATRVLMLVVSYLLLRRRLPQLDLRPALPRLVRTLVCTAVMALALLALQSIFGAALARDYGLVAQIAALGFVVVAAAAVYVGVALLIRHPDFTTLLQTVSETRYGAVMRRVLRLS
jgi:putative peptidoglycan lipid II flippase